MANTISDAEFQAIADQYAAELTKLGYVTQQTAERFKDAQIGIKGYTATLNASLKQLGTSFKALGKDIYNGKQGVSTYNDALSSGADAVENYAKKFGPAGVALGKFTQAVVGYANAVAKQSDSLYESYQKISRSGTVGADAMSGVFENMVKFGYTMDQLGDLGALLSENSKNFGLFNANAMKGAAQFSDIAKSLQQGDIQRRFMNLGLSVDDINRGAAGYLAQEGKLAQMRGKTTAELTKGSQDYIREMEILTRLTGQTRQEMEEQREQALNIDAFYAGLQDLPEAAQKEALAMFNQMSSISKKSAAEFAANFNGAITGSTDLMMTTQGQSLKYNKEFFIQGGKAIDAMQGMSDAARPMVGISKGIAQLGGTIGLTNRETTMLANKGVDPLADSLKDVTTQVDKAAAGQNAATDAQSAARAAQIKTSQNMAEFVNLGITPVTRAMQALAEAVEWLTSLLPGAGKTRKGVIHNVKGSEVGQGGSGAGGPSVTGEVDLSGGGEAPTAPGPGASLQGLPIKSGESTAGGQTSDQLAAVAQAIYGKLGPDIKYFSAFNDQYHQGLDRDSAHKRGSALDFVLNDPSKAAEVAAMIKSMPGVKNVIDEYANLSSGGTGGHIHVEAQAKNGGVLSGPSSGYQAMLHSTEAVVPLPDGKSIPIQSSDENNQMMAAQLDKLDELVNVMKSQLGVSSKLLQMQS